MSLAGFLSVPDASSRLQSPSRSAGQVVILQQTEEQWLVAAPAAALPAQTDHGVSQTGSSSQWGTTAPQAADDGCGTRSGPTPTVGRAPRRSHIVYRIRHSVRVKRQQEVRIDVAGPETDLDDVEGGLCLSD